MNILSKIKLFILILVIISSCKTSKTTSNPKNDSDININQIEVYESDADGIPDFIYEYQEYHQPRYTNANKDGFDAPKVSSKPSSKPSPNNKSIFNNLSIPKNSDMEIEKMQDIKSDKDIEISNGVLAYSIDDTMEVGKIYVVKLRISRKLGVTQITVDLPNSEISIIKTSEVMEVLLFDPDPLESDKNFIIEPITSSQQFVDNDSTWTEWIWQVKPIKSGEHNLKLVINIKKDTKYGTQVKSINVFEQLVKIKSSPKYSIKYWVNENWKWLLTTLVIPFIIFIYNRRKKKNEN